MFQEVKITRHNQHRLAMIQNWWKYTFNKSGAVDLSSGSLKRTENQGTRQNIRKLGFHLQEVSKYFWKR